MVRNKFTKAAGRHEEMRQKPTFLIEDHLKKKSFFHIYLVIASGKYTRGMSYVRQRDLLHLHYIINYL